jgi:UDP-N-acetylmuramate: L-alanyl-gamma-D-glutamyl-meso-diaminopimelate ligase
VRFSGRRDAVEDVWRIENCSEDCSAFDIVTSAGEPIHVDWSLFGEHNAMNAVAAAAALAAVGVPTEPVAESFKSFVLPRKRLQRVDNVQSIHLYEDFAHHPTAIAHTLTALSSRHPGSRLIVALEPRSNTMRSGTHNPALGEVLSSADSCFVLKSPDLPWNPSELTDAHGRRPCEGIDGVGKLVERVRQVIRSGDVVVFMSNGGFGGAPMRLADALNEREPSRESAVH